MHLVHDSFNGSLETYFHDDLDEFSDVDFEGSFGKTGVGETMFLLKFDDVEGGVVVFDDVMAGYGYGPDGRPNVARQRSRGWFVPDDYTFDNMVEAVASRERVDTSTLEPLEVEWGRMYDFGYRESGLDGAPDMESFEALGTRFEDDMDKFRANVLGSARSFVEQGLESARILHEKRLGIKSDISPDLHAGSPSIAVASRETTTMLLHFESTEGGVLVRQRDVSVEPIGCIPCVDTCVISSEADFGYAMDMFTRRGFEPGFVSHVVANFDLYDDIFDLYDDISGSIDTVGHESVIPTKDLGPAIRLVGHDGLPQGVSLDQRSSYGIEDYVRHTLLSGAHLAQEHRRLVSISPKELVGLPTGFDASESVQVDGDNHVRLLKFDGMAGGLALFDYTTSERAGRDDFVEHKHMGMNLLMTDDAFYEVHDILIGYARERHISLDSGKSIDLGRGGGVFCDLARRLMDKDSATIELDDVVDSPVGFDQYCADSYGTGFAVGRRASRLREGISVAYEQAERMRESAGAQRGVQSSRQVSVERPLAPEADVTASM